MSRLVGLLLVVVAYPVSARAAGEPCVLVPRDGQDFIVRDASRTMFLTSTKKSLTAYLNIADEKGGKCLDVPTGKYRLEQANNVARSFMATYGDDESLAIDAVPSDLPDGAAIWNMISAADPKKTVVAQIPLETVPPITAGPISIRYSDPELNARQGNPIRGEGDPKAGVAVVNSYWSIVENIWSGTPPPKTEPFESFKRLAVANRVTLSLPNRSFSSQYYWGLDEYLADRGIWYLCGHNKNGDKKNPSWSMTVPPNCVLTTRAVTFGVRSESGPIDVWISLYKGPDKVAGGRPVEDAKRPDQVLIKARVRLANKAELQSLPISIAQRIFVDCRHEHRETIAIDGSIEAVEDATLLAKECRMYFSPLGAQADGARRKPGEAFFGTESQDLERLILAGPQKLDVVVKRDKSGDAGVAHPLIDWSQIRSLDVAPKPIDLGALPLPAKVKEGDGPLTIEVSIAALNPDVKYRFPATGTSEPGIRSDDRFSATLRPRGPFGLTCPLRIFLTVPTQFAALRVPANPSNLQSSSDSGNFEFVTFRLGLQLAFEPWDYKRGKSLYAIPFRFLGGFNFASINATSASLDPTFVLAFAVTLPVFQEEGKAASQVGTSLAIGPSFEVDLRDGHPYFLFNLGVDLFTLLAAK